MNKPYFLYIMNNSGICLFSYNFKKDVEMFQDQLFSGFITAISKFTSELNRQLGYSEDYHKIHVLPVGEYFEIMILKKTEMICTLILEVKDEDEDMKQYLEDLFLAFNFKYEKQLIKWNGDIAQFEDFSENIEKIFRKMSIFTFQIPKIKEHRIEIGKIPEKLDSLLEERIIDGQRDIAEIARIKGINVEKAKDRISELLWNDNITLSAKVYDDDIFEPKRELFYLIRAKQLNVKDEELKSHLRKFEAENLVDLFQFEDFLLQRKFDLLKAVDGFKTISNLAKEFKNLNLHDIKYLISYYLFEGDYLEKVELYPQLIAVSDQIRSTLEPQDIALSYSLENICDGESSLKEISEKIGVSLKEIKNVLDSLGKHVTYIKKYKK